MTDLGQENGLLESNVTMAETSGEKTTRNIYTSSCNVQKNKFILDICDILCPL